MKITSTGNQFLSLRSISLRTFFTLAALFVFAGSPYTSSLYAEPVTADRERMIRTVRFLSEENFPRTATHANKERTIDYIMGAFTAAGLEATRGEFALKQILGSQTQGNRDGNGDGVAIELHRHTFTNIHALKQGRTNRRIIIGAHYDAIPGSPGADDNASGIAVLIELAHLLSRTPQLNLDIELVAYDMEEVGLWGSRYHARTLRLQNVDVVCMLNLDLVGYYSDEENSQRYPLPGMSLLYGTRGDFLAMIGRPADAQLMQKAQRVFREATTLRIESFPAPNILEPLFARSDHAPFWWEGYPALFFTNTADFRNRHYHRATDTWDTLDYDRLAQVPVGLYHIILAIDAAQSYQLYPLHQ